MKLKSFKKISNSKLVKFIIIAIIFIFLALSLFLLLCPKTNLTGNAISTPTLKINYSNFEKEVAKNYIILALPTNSKAVLQFYNITNGKKQLESSFILGKSNVTKGSLENPDITLSLNSNYLKELTNNNFCQVIQKAINNGDLGVEMGLSEISLAWKYKSVLRYAGCFGI